jgi:hypothetical protein
MLVEQVGEQPARLAQVSVAPPVMGQSGGRQSVQTYAARSETPNRAAIARACRNTAPAFPSSSRATTTGPVPAFGLVPGATIGCSPGAPASGGSGTGRAVVLDKVAVDIAPPLGVAIDDPPVGARAPGPSDARR